MDANEDRLNKRIGRMIREYGHERPSSNFTYNVLKRLEHETKSSKVMSGPLIPMWSWILIAVVVCVLVSGVLGGILPNEMPALDGLTLNFTNLNRLLPLQGYLEISSPFVYGTLTLAFFVCLQVVLLRPKRPSLHLGT
jgi:hypothetical protein